ncbi:histone methylation protein [Nitzschia inconspicua]|uniref:Histone methylation protein n=1 Tax=Nitzschia inconspicua TaxID=303405 RepID=A0A9K3KXY0_9STRA|nr:histone methylation protein [Nitzschia inconspicua]
MLPIPTALFPVFFCLTGSLYRPTIIISSLYRDTSQSVSSKHPTSLSPSSVIAQILASIFLCPPDVIERWIPMMEPLPRHWHEWQHRKFIDSMLQQVYSTNTNIGYQVPLGDEWIVNNQQERQQHISRIETNERYTYRRITASTDSIRATTNNNIIMNSSWDPSTYGEITTTGVRQLIHAMNLHPQENRIDNMDDDNTGVHFYDLGSGAGKLILQMAMELIDSNTCATTTTTTTTVTVSGVELSSTRHEAAQRAKETLLQLSLKPNDCDFLFPTTTLDAVEFLQDDMLSVDLHRATHIYVASLCFPSWLLTNLEEKILRECTHTLQCIATLQRFPNDLMMQDKLVSSFQKPLVRYMEMSWTRPFGAAVYIYHRRKNMKSNKSTIK